MSFVQICISCFKYRKTDRNNVWSHWMETSKMTQQERYAAQRVTCPTCDKIRLVRKSANAAQKSDE